MAEEDKLNSITDLAEMNAEKVVEVGEEVDKLKSEISKAASGIIILNEQWEHRIEDEVNEVLKETKGKLDDTVNDVDCAFSGVISDLTKFSDETRERAPENLGDIKDEMEKFAENICKTHEKDIGLEELEKMERKTENILGVMNKESEVVTNVGEIVSKISTGFEGLDKEMVGVKLGEAADKICQFVENAGETILEKVGTLEKLDSEIIEKTTVKSEKEGEEKMDEFIKETFGKFQKLNEEVNEKIADVESVEGFKEGIGEKVNEIKVRADKESKDIVYESDDGEKQIVGRENNVAAADDLLGTASTGHLQSDTFSKNTENVEEVAEDIVPKSENDKEIQAIKKIIPPGEDVPEQVGTLSESGAYHDDYDTEEPEDIVATKLRDIVSDDADEADKLLQEAHNISEKLMEPETVNVTDQEDTQGRELHDITIDMNDSSMTSDGKTSEMQCIKDEERKLANVSIQLPSISRQTKDEHVEATDSLTEKLIMSSANETEPRVVQHQMVTEPLIIASEHGEKQQSSEATPESCFRTRKPFIADEEKTEHEIKLIAHPPQSEENVKLFADQDMADINKAQHVIPDPSNNNIPSPFQSLTLEDTLKFSTIPTALENALQSTVSIKSNDRDKIITEVAINRMQKKVEPEPQGLETLVRRTINPEIERDELKSKHETEQNVEILTSEEKAGAVAAECEAKHETMQKSESQKTNTELPTQIQILGAQKTEAHSIPSTAEGGLETVTERDKTDTMKSKSSDGRQQQTRRCTVL
ncbi:hypothetical protein LOAG_16756 [Loa loa]|uniref:Titin homolog n=1 Tax=Loa loa TaxID=7209 RepID=A0A1I7VUL3_LOALO|nr:hypothetical protein LOAG_16756 [Loa loa]EJD76258.1 hypothetical protein LOAG_16756 [Loa loa]